MSLTLEQKAAIITEIADVAAKAPSAVAAEYTGLNVLEMTHLRRSARAAGVYLKVVRNTLARRALEGTPFECMRDGLVGPLILAFSSPEPGSAAKVMRDFVKQNERLIVKLVAINGRLLEVGALDRLASLPSLNDARSMVLGVLQAPMGKFVRVLSEPAGQFARLLTAYKDQRKDT
ncbi:MAG: 50S ribosomal protein L10 [Gammaproteobacteria bacterium]|nr:50S ribosomal protein L10 [Gammaproteobacteria bacterium]